MNWRPIPPLIYKLANAMGEKQQRGTQDITMFDNPMRMWGGAFGEIAFASLLNARKVIDFEWSGGIDKLPDFTLRSGTSIDVKATKLPKGEDDFMVITNKVQRADWLFFVIMRPVKQEYAYAYAGACTYEWWQANATPMKKGEEVPDRFTLSVDSKILLPLELPLTTEAFLEKVL